MKPQIIHWTILRIATSKYLSGSKLRNNRRARIIVNAAHEDMAGEENGNAVAAVYFAIRRGLAMKNGRRQKSRRVFVNGNQIPREWLIGNDVDSRRTLINWSDDLAIRRPVVIQ